MPDDDPSDLSVLSDLLDGKSLEETPAEPVEGQEDGPVAVAPAVATRRPSPAPAPEPIAQVARTSPVSESIADKLLELEERLAAAAPPLTVVVPEATPLPPLPKKAPAAKRSPAKKVVPAPVAEEIPAAEPVVDAVAEAPVEEAFEAAGPAKKIPAAKAAPPKAVAPTPTAKATAVKKTPAKKAAAAIAAPVTDALVAPGVELSPEPRARETTTIALPPADLDERAPRRAKPRPAATTTVLPALETPSAGAATGSDIPAALLPQPRKPFGAGLRAMVVATVLLLAAAAGMGAAAVVENGSSTWKATSVVQILPGPHSSLDPQEAVAAGVKTYAQKAATTEFRDLATSSAGLKAADVPERISGASVANDELRLSARAATADAADALADAAATSMVQTVTSNELSTVTAPGDRLGAKAIGRSAQATQVEPKDATAYLAGALAAGLVLVLALIVGVMRREKRS